MRDVDRLTACLADLDRSGWKFGEYFATRPDISDSVFLSLQAASRVHALSRPVPSEAFRARSRAHLVTFIQNQALLAPTRTRQARIRQAVDALFRPLVAPVAAAMLVLGGSAGVWSASAASLPGTPLYGAKVAIERVQILTAFTPAQQVSVHLSVASARLKEANTEAWAGNRAAGETLLRDYDREIAQAQTILLSQANSPGSDSLLAQSDWELVLLQEERQRLVANTVAPSVAPPSIVAGIAQENMVEVKPTVSPEDPSKLQPSQASIVSEPAITNDTSSVTAPPGLVGITGAIAVAIGQTDFSTDSSVVTSFSVTDRLDRLVRILLAQSSAGDELAAGTTAREFALDVKEGLANGTLSADRLSFDRSRLEAALGVAPPSTQTALRIALTAIGDAIPPARKAPTVPVKHVSTAAPAVPAVSAVPTAPAVPTSPGSAVAPNAASGPAVPPVANRTPIAGLPNPIVPVPNPAGPPHPSSGASHPDPVIGVPKLPPTLIPRPIIVRDPSQLPSPALTGKKPLTIAKKQPIR